MGPIPTQQTARTDVHHRLSTRDGAVQSFLVAVTLLAVSSLGGLAIIEGFRLLQPTLGLGESFGLTFIVGGSLATLWFAIVGVAYIRVRPVTIRYGIRRPSLRDGAWIVAGVGASILAAILTDLLVNLFGSGWGTNISSAAAVENPVFIYSLFIVANLVFLAPIEEFLFRGVIQGRLRESFGAIAAISITSIGFALTHIPSYWFGGSELLSVGVWGALLGIAAAGFILGYVYERTHSLLVVSIIHGLVNTLSISLALIAAL